MEDYQSHCPYKDKLPQLFLKTTRTLQGPHNLERAKQFGRSGGFSPTTPELPSFKPPNNIHDPDVFLFSNKDDSLMLTPNESYKYGFQHSDHHMFQNHEKQMQLDGAFHLNLHPRLDEYQQEFNNVRRSRGISFYSDQEMRENEGLLGPDFDLMRYVSNHGHQDTETSREGAKADYERNYTGLEEEDNGLGIGNSGPLLAKTMAHYFQSNQLHKILQDDNDNVMPLDQQTQSSEQPLHKSGEGIEETLEEEVTKKRKVSESKSLVITGEKKKPQAAKRKIQKSASAACNSLPITPKNCKLTKINTPKKSTRKASAAVPSIKTENNAEEKAKNTMTGWGELKSEENLAAEVKTEDTLSVPKNKSFGIPTDFQSLEKLFYGLKIPAEVEEFISKSKIFINLGQQKSKKIGPLTYEERQAKVEKYLQKRKERSWCKRINYDCRKRVAETRLRVKGRFVTKAQAFGMLEAEGIAVDKNQISEADMKTLLEGIFEKRKNREENKGTRKMRKSNKIETRQDQELARSPESGKESSSGESSREDC